MLTQWAKRIVHSVLPAATQDWLRDHRPWRPGGSGRINEVLDGWVTRRTMKLVLAKTDALRHIRWLDRSIWQFPIDAWILQEVVSELRPELIVETGTYRGGSAYYFATLLDLLDVPGEVVSIDVAAERTISHPRITYLIGSSIDSRVLDELAPRVRKSRQVLVVLDSDHSASHVERELELYAPMVPVGGYLHVQDGWVDELGFARRTGPGPVSAVRRFLANHPEFVRDLDVERRYVLTANPHGWLRRVAEDPQATTAIRPV